MYDTFLQSSDCNVFIYNGLLYASSLMPSGVSTWCVFGMTIQTKGKTMNALTCCYSVMANSSIWFSATFNSRTGAIGPLDPDPDEPEQIPDREQNLGWDWFSPPCVSCPPYCHMSSPSSLFSCLSLDTPIWLHFWKLVSQSLQINCSSFELIKNAACRKFRLTLYSIDLESIL